MRRAWHQKSPSNRSLLKTSTRQLMRGRTRPPMSKSPSSRSLKRTQMVRQTSTTSISRSSVTSNGDVGRSSGHRPSVLSRTSSISRMTVVYQETSCELPESFDDLSNSEFDASVVSFVPDDDDVVDDCMSRIDQPILEYEEQTDQAKDPISRRLSTSSSRYSLKSIRRIGEKLGLSRKKSSQALKDEEESKQTVEVREESVTVIENNTQVFKRSVSNVLSFKIGANKKEVKPEPWMLLQADQTSMPWHDRQDARMLTPYRKEESQATPVRQTTERRERRMQRRASM